MNEATSARVALTLMNMGYTRVYALKGGWHEWQDRGYPIEPK